MTVRDFLLRNARLEIGEETTFQTEPAGTFPNAMTPLVISPSSLVVQGLKRKAIENADEDVRQRGAKDRILGLKSDESKVEFAFDLKAVPSAAFLIDGVSAGARYLSHRLPLRHMFGTEHVDEGSTVATGTSTTVFDVATGHGSRFQRGTWIAVENNAGTAMQPCRVESVSTDTLTVHPPLAATPDTGSVVRNGYNYALAGSGVTAPNQKSLSIRRVFSAYSELQYQLLGIAGDVQFKLPQKFGELISLAFSGMVTDWSQSAAGFSAAVVSDDMGSKAVYHQATLLLAARASLARGTTRRYEGAELTLPSKWDKILDGNANQAVAGVMQTAGRPSAVSGSLKVPYDAAEYAAFTDRTARNLVLWVQVGSGLTASFLVWDVPNLVLVDNPEVTTLGEGRGGMMLRWEGLPDAGYATPTTDADFSPLRFAML